MVVGAGCYSVDSDNWCVPPSRGATEEGVGATLRLAMERYGDRIAVNGSAAFKKQVARIAATANLSLTFTDPELERRRQSMVRCAGRSEVTLPGLPGHVPGHMEHQGAKSDHGVRRDISRPGVTTTPSGPLANKSIAEREAERLNGFDIPKHSRYTDDDAGPLAFAGLRQVGGKPVTVTPKGSINTKGRSR